MVSAITSMASGLVERGASEHVDQFRVADGGAERGVLGQIEVLAGQRRNDDAQCLRHDDEPQPISLLDAERLRGLCLSVAHRPDARPHGLSDEGRRVDAQPEDQGDQFAAARCRP